MQGQQLLDPRLGQDALELRLAQLLGLAQVLVKRDQPGDPLALGVREPEMPAEPIGDPAADLVVVVEAGPP